MLEICQKNGNQAIFIELLRRMHIRILCLSKGSCYTLLVCLEDDYEYIKRTKCLP